MYLRRLDLHGFKSFAEKTTLSFSPGVTGIVGPNGCGKSNLIDAVRWVLGEQRPRLLRSDQMADVIFNGSPGKRALGLAEVSLTIENADGVLPTEYSEVTVARRLYRSGDSEYLLNGSVCRLKDILDLFMDTGVGPDAYSVMELKMVEDILSDNAEDRRRLFEEAAGVTKYKRRRAQAYRKLDATRNDLGRLTDLVDEVAKQVRSLKRQAGKAKRYKKLSTRLQTLELSLSAHDFSRLQEEREAFEAKLQAGRITSEGAAAQIAANEARLEEARTELVGKEQTLAERRAALADHAEEIRGLESELRVLAERNEAAEQGIERLSGEREADQERIEEIQSREATLVTELEAAKEARDSRKQEVKAAETKLEEAREQANAQRERRDEAQREAEQAQEAFREAQMAQARLRDRREVREQEIARLQTESREFEEALQTFRGESESHLEEAEARLETTEKSLREARGHVAEKRESLERAENALRDARVVWETANAEVQFLESLVASGDDSSAHRFLAEESGWKGELLTVADIAGCDENDRLAVDVALGEWASCIVVEDEAAADDAIARLQKSEQGRATFIVLSRLQGLSPRKEVPAPPGTTAAIECVRASRRRFRPLLKRLLHNVFVTDSLKEARALSEEFSAARFVTRNGHWLDGMGAIHGGSTESRGSAKRLGAMERLQAAEASRRKANEQRVQAEADVDSAKEELAAWQSQRDQKESERDEARRDVESARTAAARREAEHESLKRQAARNEERRSQLEEEAAGEPDPADLDREIGEKEEAARDASDVLRKAEALFNEKEADRKEAEAEWNDARLAFSEAGAAADRAESVLEQGRRMLADLDRREKERTSAAEELRETISRAETASGEIRERLERKQGQTDGLQEAVEKAEGFVLEVRATISDIEQALRENRRDRDSEQEHLTQAEVRLTQLATRQEAIEDRLREEHGVSLVEASDVLEKAVESEEEEEPFEADAAREEIPALKEKIRSLGAINELALESYEEERERLDFLTEQKNDLEEAEATLLSTIDEINKTARERFDETFEKVREAFQQLFKQLFGEKASADLLLDGDDPLEAVVEIKARPKGKKVAVLSQLSGGEKTLTAIALLFSLYLVKPSPFCILDEVDAPLDDANIQRYMHLIRSFTDRTQFILVTHNKLTMEAADRMYGVTMPTPGVSRLVGVRFDQVGADGTVQEEVEEVA